MPVQEFYRGILVAQKITAVNAIAATDVCSVEPVKRTKNASLVAVKKSNIAGATKQRK